MGGNQVSQLVDAVCACLLHINPSVWKGCHLV